MLFARDGGFLEFVAYLYVLRNFKCQNRDQRRKTHKKHYYFTDFKTKIFKILKIIQCQMWSPPFDHFRKKNWKKVSLISQNLFIPHSFLRKNTIPVVRNCLKCNQTPLEPAKVQKTAKMRFLAVNYGMITNSKKIFSRRFSRCYT